MALVVQVGTWKLGSLSGKGGDVCEEQRKSMMDVSCSQEVRWRRKGARMLGMKGRRYKLGMKGRRYKLWCSGKGDLGGGVGIMEELREKVVEVIRVSDSVMTVVVLKWDVPRSICGYAPQSGRSWEEKQTLYDKLKDE